METGLSRFQYHHNFQIHYTSELEYFEKLHRTPWNGKCIDLSTTTVKYSKISKEVLHVGINPLTPGAFSKKTAFFDILAVLRLDFGQISFNLVENAFATRQLAVLAPGIAFYDILARACAEIKNIFGGERVTYVLKLFDFLNFSFSFLFAAVIDLLLAMGLLAAKRLLRKRHRDGQFLRWSTEPGEVAGILLSVFHSTF